MRITARSSNNLHLRRGRGIALAVDMVKTHRYYVLSDNQGVRRCIEPMSQHAEGPIARMQHERKPGDRVHTVWHKAGRMSDVVHAFENNRQSLVVKDGYH